MAVASTLDLAPERTLSDRWIYVFMAGLFVAVALVGFAPKSTAILTGELPVPPLVIHVHAAFMVAWLALLLAQTLLMANRQPALHKRLGLLSLVLAPCLVGGMVAATLWRYEFLDARGLRAQAANLLLAQGRAIVYFTLFFLWAVLTRRKDPETHKRMMLLATLVLIPAAITRMTWLPTTFPQSFAAPHLYMLLILTPALLHDTVRLGRPHTAYIAGFVAFLPCLIATHVLWNLPWWHQTVPRFMGP
jgi:hypothetical protein